MKKIILVITALALTFMTPPNASAKPGVIGIFNPGTVVAFSQWVFTPAPALGPVRLTINYGGTVQSKVVTMLPSGGIFPGPIAITTFSIPSYVPGNPIFVSATYLGPPAVTNSGNFTLPASSPANLGILF